MTKRLTESRAAGSALGLLGVGVVVSGVVASSATGCLHRPIEPIDPRTTKTVVDQLPVAIDRIDVILAIDNSSSMADKQKILANAVPKLVDRLVNPSCVAKSGDAPPTQPASPKDECPDGFKREFKALADINIGIISSSLGDLNSQACAGAGHPNDGGHLLARDTKGMAIDTYKNQGFLAWDPLNHRAGTNDPTLVKTTLSNLVGGIGQDGCGYEMQLESVVRFLVDPAPYASLETESNVNRKSGQVDQQVLIDRANFLRPDSLVAILMLTDENDCSMKPEGFGFNALAADPNKKNGFYRGSSICATNPDDKCCYSCGLQSPPAGCEADPICTSNPKYTYAEDPLEYRCWDQKRRYGADFLYPPARYVNAFTQPYIDPSRDDLAVVDQAKQVRNPLFANLSQEKVSTRTPDRIFFAGIVGVPWQAIARAGADGKPDVKAGFKSYGELLADKLFDKLVGDPQKHVSPTDPFMVESPSARPGTSDVLGASPSQANGINGGDNDTKNNRLEYACTFDLNCGSQCTASAKDCGDDPSLCVNGQQTRAKAYPGLRQLSVLEGMKSQGIVASVCPANLTDENDFQSFGYNPAVNAIIEQLKHKLNAQCIPTQLQADEKTGQVDCLAIEARTLKDGETCACDEVARVPVVGKHLGVVAAIQSDFTADASWDCFCEITQVQGTDALTACQNVPDDAIGKVPVDGWCYLDGTTVPPIGSAALLDGCLPDEKHAIRFVNKGEPAHGSRAIITCANE